MVSIAGPIITQAKPDAWAISLNAFQPDFRSTTPNVQLLSVALNTVNEGTPLPGMKRAILVITPHMDDPNIDLLLTDIGEQALASKVRIFVWFVDSDLYFNTASATALRRWRCKPAAIILPFQAKFYRPETYFAPPGICTR
jgi:hypothetical protein